MSVVRALHLAKQLFLSKLLNSVQDDERCGRAKEIVMGGNIKNPHNNLD